MVSAKGNDLRPGRRTAAISVLSAMCLCPSSCHFPKYPKTKNNPRTLVSEMGETEAPPAPVLGLIEGHPVSLDSQWDHMVNKKGFNQR